MRPNFYCTSKAGVISHAIMCKRFSVQIVITSCFWTTEKIQFFRVLNLCFAAYTSLQYLLGSIAKEWAGSNILRTYAKPCFSFIMNTDALIPNWQLESGEGSDTGNLVHQTVGLQKTPIVVVCPPSIQYSFPIGMGV